MTLHILSVAYHRPVELTTLCGCFLRQTNPNWELTIMHDGTPPQKVKDVMSIYGDNRIHFKHTKKVNGYWGHPNRKTMLERLRGDKDDFILMTNDDNLYVPTFIETMFACIDSEVGFVMCDTLHSYINYSVMTTQLKENHIDMGSFIVRYDIAKKIGFNYINFSADGKYAEECGKYCHDNALKILHVKKPLFIHC
jgi:GT2 family glycosyltransferase